MHVLQGFVRLKVMHRNDMQVRRLHDTFHEPFRRTLRQQQLRFEATQATQTVASGSAAAQQGSAPGTSAGMRVPEDQPVHAASQAEAASLAAAARSSQQEAPNAAMLTDRGLADVHDDGSGDDDSG